MFLAVRFGRSREEGIGKREENAMNSLGRSASPMPTSQNRDMGHPDLWGFEVV
jgi:hypothetical protein